MEKESKELATAMEIVAACLVSEEVKLPSMSARGYENTMRALRVVRTTAQMLNDGEWVLVDKESVNESKDD